MPAMAGEHERSRKWVRHIRADMTGRLPPTDDEGRTAHRLRALRTNADDRLALDPLGRVESGDCIVERRHLADVCPQPPVAHPLGELTQLRSIGLDDEV